MLSHNRIPYLLQKEDQHKRALSFLLSETEEGKKPFKKEEKAAFEAYGLQLTLEDYGKFLMLSNNVTSELTKIKNYQN